MTQPSSRSSLVHIDERYGLDESAARDHSLVAQPRASSTASVRERAGRSGCAVLRREHGRAARARAQTVHGLVINSA